MAEIRVETWVNLISEIYFEPVNKELNRYRSQCVYRGMTDAIYELTPGLMRVGEHFADVEMLLVNDFQKYAHRDASPGDSFWNWLAVAQHRGLPTRFLDWTFSPFVALHFATSNLGAGAPGTDAVIWAVNYVETNKLLSDRLAYTLKKNRKNIFSVEMLDDAVPDLSALDQFQDCEFILFMEPPSLDERIVNQAALFSVMSRPKGKPGQSAPTDGVDEFLKRKQRELGPSSPELFKKIIIASDLKWEIRDRLDQANITERVMFPGMDGLSSWLKRHYTKRGGAVLTSPESKSKDIRLEKLGLSKRRHVRQQGPTNQKRPS
jgi:FRG domain